MNSKSFLTPRPLWHRAIGLLVAVLVALIARHFVSLELTGFLVANSFQWVDWVSMECLDLVLNKLAVASGFSTNFEKEFNKSFAVNDQVRIKKPQRWNIRNGLGYTPDPINRIFTTVDLNQPFGIDFEVDSIEKALRMERSQAAISKEYIEPAMAQIAQEIDSRAALFAYQNTNNFVGVLGTDPVDFDTTSAAARQRLVELGSTTHDDDRYCIVPPNIMRALKKSAIGYFNPVTDISKQFRTGIVGSGDGFDWYESMSLYSHTSGVWAGAVTVTTAPAQGATSIVLTCTTGDTFKAGDCIDFNAAFQVNPMTRRKTTSVLKPFVVLVDTVGVANSATVTFSPAIYGPGSQYQNVDALPIAGATVTMFRGTAAPTVAHSGVNGLAFTKEAFAIVGCKLEMPENVEPGSFQRQDPETGIAVQYIRMFDPVNRKMINRFDVLLGFGRLYSDECSVRILGA
jgi:P22 coat protein - gene protein 5